MRARRAVEVPKLLLLLSTPKWRFVEQQRKRWRPFYVSLILRYRGRIIRSTYHLTDVQGILSDSQVCVTQMQYPKDG